MKKKNRPFAWEVAGLAALLSLAVMVSGCSFVGRRGEGPSSDSSAASDEDALPDREEVPDDPEKEDPDVAQSSSKAASDEEKPSASQIPPAPASSSSSASSSSAASSGQSAGAASSSPAASSAPPAASSAAPSSSGTGSPASSGGTGSAGAAQNKPASSSAEKPASSLKNVTYVKKGAYTKQENFQNASVRGSGMLIRNKTFYGDMTITSKAGDDGITLQDVDIRGTLTVQGGSDWLKLYGCSVGDLVVDYKGAKVFASQNTSVGSVTVKKDATLQEGELTGNACGFEDIEVSGKKGETLGLTLKNLDTGKLTTRTGAVLETDKNSQIDILNAHAATRIKGSAPIGELTAYADGVYYDKRPDKLYTSGGADRPRPYEGNSGKEDETYDKDVSIDPLDDITVERGDEYTVWVESNARSLSASSSNRDVASVSVGADDDCVIITARRVGEAVITVKGTRSGYNSDSVKFTVEVVSSRSESPVITILSGEPAAWTNRDVPVSFRVTDTDLYEVRADGHTWRNAQTDYSFSVSQNGEYEIEATDAKGNKAKASVTITRIDKDPPQILDLAAAGLNVSFRVADTGSGVIPAKVQAVSPDGVSFTPTPQDGIYRFTAEHGKTYTISAVDEAGNAAMQKISVQADQKPNISSAPVVSDADAYTRQKTVSFAVTYPDGMLPQVQFVYNGAFSAPLAPLTTSAAGAGYSVCAYSFVATEPGDYTVKAANAAGEAAAQVTVAKIDHEKPAISGIQVDNASVAPTKPVSFVATDTGGSGVSSVTVTLSGAPVEAVPAANGSYTFIAEADGDYQIVAADHAGNISDPVTVKVENVGQPPAGPASPQPPADTTEPPAGQQTPPASAEQQTPPASDSPAPGPLVPVIGDLEYDSEQVKAVLSASKQVHFKVSNVAAEDTLTVATDDGQPVTLMSDGSWWFSAVKPDYTVTVKTGSGAQASRHFTVANIDAQPVEVSILNGDALLAGSSRALEQEVRFTIKAGKSMETGRVTVSPAPKSEPVKGADGSYTFTVNQNGTYTIKAQNGVGKTGSASVGVDSVGPSSSMIGQPLLSPAAQEWARQKTVSFTLSSAELGVRVTGPDSREAVVNGTGVNRSFTAVQNGNYTIFVTFAGKSAEMPVSVSGIDNTPPAAPSLVSPADGKTLLPANTAANPIAAAGQVFSVSVPAADGQSPLSFSYSFDNGQTWLPLGPSASGSYQLHLQPLAEGQTAATLSLLLRAQDAAGNSAQSGYVIALSAPAAREQGSAQDEADSSADGQSDSGDEQPAEE